MGSGNEIEESSESPQNTEVDSESSQPEVNHQNHQMYGEQSIFMNQSKNNSSQNKASNTSPQPEPIPDGSKGTQSQSEQTHTANSSSGDWDQSINQGYDGTKQQKEFLEEIEPIPFDNSYLDSDSKRDAGIQEPQNPSTPNPDALASQNSQTTVSISPERRKRLERDMKDVLSFLSEKMPSIDKSGNNNNEKLTKQRAQVEKKIKPETINDILKQLLRIDKNIEASAIIKNDGKKLASAISNRISDPLFGTIGQNLSMIGSDIINGLNAGSLRSISVRGTDGVLDLAPVSQDDPILKNFLLIIFSNPNVKSGMIQIAIRKISSQLKEFL